MEAFALPCYRVFASRAKQRIRSTKLHLFAILTALSLHGAVLSGCNRDSNAQLDRPRQVNGVKMLDVSFYSEALGRSMPYRVYLPASGPSGQRLPVVYLLHGGGDDFRAWSNDSAVADYARSGLILVMPDGDESYYMNEVEAPKKRFKDYITRDLIEDVESRFPARKDRKGRAIIGVSMGGFAAIEYALTEPQLFDFVGALSPSIDVPFRRYSFRRIGQWWKFRTIFGPFGSQDRASRDPSRLVWTADPAVTPFIYLTAGEQEPLLEPNRRFASLLKRRGFAFEFHTKPGGHAWNQWNTQIPDCFASLAQHLHLNSN
jgi:S-formylglutathione hydrolase FrmB